jgi:hypothetical protein
MKIKQWSLKNLYIWNEKTLNIFGVVTIPRNSIKITKLNDNSSSFLTDQEEIDINYNLISTNKLESAYY